VSKRLTTEELIARIEADLAELKARLAGGGMTTQSGPGEGEEPTDRF
jgi:hypothetical protein